MAGRVLMRVAMLAFLVVLCSASDHDDHAVEHDDDHLNAEPVYAPVHAEHALSTQLATPGNGTTPDVVEGEQKGFSGMYFGLLTGFVILWTIYFFVYFFETGYGGDSYFYGYSYVVLFILISSGLSNYFTASIVTGILVSFLFASIAAMGFGAMMTITSPDRFEGDKSNMGRTRLDNSMM